MTVRDLIDELQGMDPDAEVRFFHLRRVMKDGSCRVESYPVLEVAEGGDGEVTLADFLCEGTFLFKIRRAEWEQPALKSQDATGDDEDGDEQFEADPLPASLPPVDTLLVDPPFTKEEWSTINVRDIGQEDSPLGQRVMNYLHQYHRAVMGSNRLHRLMGSAGLPSKSAEPFDERLLLRVLKQLVDKHDSTVHGIEVMMATVDFAGYLRDEGLVTLGPATLEWLQKVESLVVLTLVVCVNRHFGLIR